MPSLTRQQVRKVDQLAIEALGISGLVLMENAGRNTADAVERFCESRRIGKDKPVSIVAGAGNNGGDGFVVARHLLMRSWAVRVFLVSPRQKIAGDADANLRIIERLGIEIHPLDSHGVSQLAGELASAGVVIDAIGGTGIHGPLRGDLAIAVEQVNAAGRPVIAVDISTGLDCDSGLPSGPVVRADLTVTFVASKVGFDNPGAKQYTGEIIVADIGIPADKVLGMEQ